MAEIQTNTESGEMTQRFVEFVMMQAQNAALFLGQIPSPDGQGPEVNLEVAKMFIDQLAMIREKTKGNLSDEEQRVLANALSNLQMVFVEVSQKMKTSGAAPTAAAPTPEPVRDTEKPAPSIESTPTGSDDSESKKRFTKSYGS